jgi:hypothetical protein
MNKYVVLGGVSVVSGALGFIVGVYSSKKGVSAGVKSASSMLKKAETLLAEAQKVSAKVCDNLPDVVTDDQEFNRMMGKFQTDDPFLQKLAEFAKQPTNSAPHTTEQDNLADTEEPEVGSFDIENLADEFDKAMDAVESAVDSDIEELLNSWNTFRNSSAETRSSHLQNVVLPNLEKVLSNFSSTALIERLSRWGVPANTRVTKIVKDHSLAVLCIQGLRAEYNQ